MDISGKATVFSKEVATQNGEVFNTYSLGISSKNQKGEWVNGYMNVNFPKGVVVQNKVKIDIKKGWLIVYMDKDNKPKIKAFVSEFDVLEQQPASSNFEVLGEPENLPF